MKSFLAVILLVANFSLDDIILDIYNAVTEISETDYEQLQTDLYALHQSPIDLNHATDEDLERLYFLSPHQIDEILAYVGRHPMESLYELRLIQSLADYEIRDLLPFVTLTHPPYYDNNNKMYAREVFHYAKHEILTRIDARKVESFEGTDPMYIQARYVFNYHRRVSFGAQLRRPAGGKAEDLQYGAWLQLRDIGPLHSLVAGNFQANFGYGLVFAPVFHSGKSAYVTRVGLQPQGLRYYSSVDGEGLHGVGATFRKYWSRQTRLDVSALYSMKRANDSIWHHVLGANITLRHKKLQVELTMAENLWSDSIHPYNNAQYNQHYFRGRRQAVLGASCRYNHGWFDLFGEVATAQNKEHWGAGVLIGSRFYPTDGVALVALYRYYSPYFDNALGYSFSETSRIGDENGGYVGFELTRWRNWRISGYGDVFYFSGPKYGIKESPSLGYDALGEMRYNKTTGSRAAEWWTALRLRARKKGDKSTYSARYQFNWQQGGWSLRTTAEGNISHQQSAVSNQTGYGVTVYQDVALDFAQLTSLNKPIPLSLKLRLQAFDAREWDNRIYAYEHDVLYAFSIPAVYGLGGRAYVCLKWQIIPRLALYARVSETVYQPRWAAEHNKSVTQTDIHVLLRAGL